MRWFVIFIIHDVITNSIQVLVLAGAGNKRLIKLLIPSGAVWNWIPFNQFIVLNMFILYALLIQSTRLQKWELKVWLWKTFKIRISTILYIGLHGFLSFTTIGLAEQDYLLLSIFSLYFSLCLFRSFRVLVLHL